MDTDEHGFSKGLYREFREFKRIRSKRFTIGWSFGLTGRVGSDTHSSIPRMFTGTFMFTVRSRATNARRDHCSCQTTTPPARLIRRRAYSVAAGLVFLFAASARAQIGFEQVRSFGFPEGMGDSASGGVIEGSDHKLYGTTVEGGANGNFGVVYSLQRDGTGYAVVHHFLGAPSDGAQSVASLAEGPSGILYGTTSSGGTTNGGAVFKLNQDGSG